MSALKDLASYIDNIYLSHFMKKQANIAELDG